MAVHQQPTASNKARRASSADGKSYHHGDLRNALIVAAGELIEEKGSLDFAMIDAARRAKVSSAAPYRHFQDRDALLQAVSDVAFLALEEISTKVAASKPYGSIDCIVAVGKAYINFVTDHPAFYDLLWGDRGLHSRNLSAMALKASGYYILVDSVGAWSEQAGLKNDDSQELAVKLWAISHGLACLAMNNSIGQVMPGEDVFTLFESSVNTFLEGLRPSGQVS